MTAVYLIESEWFPVFEPLNEMPWWRSGARVTVTDDQLKRWQDAEAAFVTAQKEMREAYDSGEHMPNRPPPPAETESQGEPA